MKVAERYAVLGRQLPLERLRQGDDAQERAECPALISGQIQQNTPVVRIVRVVGAS